MLPLKQLRTEGKTYSQNDTIYDWSCSADLIVDALVSRYRDPGSIPAVCKRWSAVDLKDRTFPATSLSPIEVPQPVPAWSLVKWHIFVVVVPLF